MPIDTPIRTMTFIRLDEFKFDKDEKEEIIGEAFASGIPDYLVGVATDVLGNVLFRDNDSINIAIQSLVQTVNPDTKIYKMRINPTTLKVTQAKQMTLNEYGNEEFELQIWKNKLDTYSYTGTTGSLVPGKTFIASGMDDIRLSQAWQKFEIFKKYFSDTNSMLAVIYEDEIFLGFFAGSFSFDRDAHNPFQIKYTFDLKVIPSTRMNLFTGMLGAIGTGLNILSTLAPVLSLESVPIIGGGSVPNLLGTDL